MIHGFLGSSNGVVGTFVEGCLITNSTTEQIDSVLCTRVSPKHGLDRAKTLAMLTEQPHDCEKVKVFIDLAVAKQMVADFETKGAVPHNEDPQFTASVVFAASLLSMMSHLEPAVAARSLRVSMPDIRQSVLPNLMNLIINTIGISQAQDLCTASLEMLIKRGMKGK